ncbi:MAG TPA: protein kinase, partial [Polyangiales bacterium]|nr:protein kinase [Polyangiales bacterium]
MSSVDDTIAQRVTAGDVIAGRYRVEDQLGRGGMAHVFRVHDVSTGRELALKRLLPSGSHSDANAAGFAREYYTLRQLTHPSIIEVYEYGFDREAPYYTMELLSGQDLSSGAPFEWQDAARLLMSVASSLAVLHSRRLIHRDVTATNVRYTQGLTAKLIDFGAMVEMGAVLQAVGTVPYMAPEALNQQPLDQRLDLYALGALAYFMVTGRHAYPARHVAQLRELWSLPLTAASSLQHELPEPFSRLIGSLLELEPWARPSSAAEVMERLSAIAGLPLAETAAVREAYLTTPRLVGRDAEVEWLRTHVARASAGRGGAALLRGPVGIGRSRMLDACVLEAKLAGLSVLRADARDGRAFAATRALLEQVWAALPAERTAAPPEIAQLGEAPITEASRPQLQAALQQWLLSLADRHGLVLAVDDLQAVDEPSAALLALLASRAAQHRLLIAATLADDVPAESPRPLALLSSVAAGMALAPLSAAHTEQLLRSVFGSVARIRLLADRLHARSEGNPSALMELGQHLVSTGVVRYEGGAWLIPERFAADALPERVEQALRARIVALPAEARSLAETLAACQDLTLDAEAYASLAGLPDQASYHAALDALSASGVLTGQVFRHAASATWLRESVTPERARQLHVRIAALLDQRGGQPLRAAVHWRAAGEQERALDAAIALASGWLNRDRASAQESRDAQLVLSEAFPRTLEVGLGSIDAHPRPARARFSLLLALAYAAVYGRPELMKRYLAQTLERLRLDSGLRDF